ncbi:MAG: hypothetical protein JRN20_14610 [Nitrososphaerota archaeon]|jgi:hypothetical protein|nr:hypothetical protein [Nitrososphaerota archaeon]
MRLRKKKIPDFETEEERLKREEFFAQWHLEFDNNLKKYEEKYGERDRAEKAEIERRRLEEAQAKRSIQILIDFSSIKDYIEKGGLVVSPKCPSCGASITLPTTGTSVVCQFCKSPVQAIDIFEKIKELVESAK